MKKSQKEAHSRKMKAAWAEGRFRGRPYNTVMTDEIKEVLSDKMKAAWAEGRMKPRTRSGKDFWPDFDELYRLWLDFECGHKKFKSIADSLGYEYSDYAAMVRRFKAKKDS